MLMRLKKSSKPTVPEDFLNNKEGMRWSELWLEINKVLLPGAIKNEPVSLNLTIFLYT
jgi:hypothetical protein